jgi:hypothetical protein
MRKSILLNIAVTRKLVFGEDRRASVPDRCRPANCKDLTPWSRRALVGVPDI